MGESYSYRDDLNRTRKERMFKQRMKAKKESTRYESRPYTERDEDFARRFNAGARMFGGQS